MIGQLEGHSTLVDELKRVRLQLLVVIIDRNNVQKMHDILHDKSVHFHYVCLARGTANSELLNILGLGSTDKALVLCIVPHAHVTVLMEAIVKKLNFAKRGNGVAFSVNLSGTSISVFSLFDEKLLEDKVKLFEKEVEKMSTNSSHDVIISIINHGFTEALMTAAKTAGAKGGTVINARRVATEDVVNFMGIPFQSEKEIVAILTDKENKHEIMKAIGTACGGKTPAKGIVFSVPVDTIAGLDFGKTVREPENH